MADIAMCSGKDCPIKMKCYRYKAKKGFWQFYYTEIPYDFKKKDCKKFLNIE